MTALNNLFLLLEQQLIHYRKEDFIKILSEDFFEYGSSGGIMDKTYLIHQMTEQGIEDCLFTVKNFRQFHLQIKLCKHDLSLQIERMATGKTAVRFGAMKTGHGGCSFIKEHQQNKKPLLCKEQHFYYFFSKSLY
ncbi:hypothetical protein MKY07_11705 [Solibacillus sp. FSL W7-1472]|uniref:hypothetical protein n=1 Tax=Solibacillus sp. FSL W7-1472 TaxID=2921707 RepID=UPI0030D85A39